MLPKSPKIPFDVVNKLMTKREISNMIDQVYRHCGQKETVIFCDRIMALGFHNAFKAGISFGKDDMVVPELEVEDHRADPQLAKEFEQQYNDGLITQGEKYNKVVDAWSKSTDQIADEMMSEISAVKKGPDGRDMQINSIYMMAHSGARGSPAQMRQLAGMRGLMAKPSGEIIESPIISNFKEGLSVLEYFNSTHGARKGLADTALKTANSGYLTRRLVDVAQDCIITTEDCGTAAGIKVRAIIDAGRSSPRSATASSAAPRPRTCAIRPRTRSSSRRARCSRSRRSRRSSRPACRRCASARCSPARPTTGVCGKCYGRDLARGTPVNIGEAVGVIAAQSIGEPGTQLTMRTFHIGGAAQISEQSFVESNFDGKIKIKNKNIMKNSDGQMIAMARNMVVAVLDPDGTERAVHRIQYGARMRVDDGDKIKRGQRIAEWDPYTRPILTEVDGTSASRTWSKASRCRRRSTNRPASPSAWSSTGVPVRPRQQDLRPSMVIKDKDGKILKLGRGGEARYQLAVDAIISVDPGAQ